MSSDEEFSSRKAPLSDGIKYAFWRLRMQTYLSALGFDIWESFKSGYIVPSTSPIDTTSKKLFESDSKVQNAIISGLVDSELVKVMGCTTAKKIWDKLKSIHEGDDKIKKAKLQTFQAHFESLKMNEDKDVVAYMLRVNEVINVIRGLGETIEDMVIVKRVLRSLSSKFDSKVLAIEEAKDFNAFSLDEMHGSLTAWEMRTIKAK